MSLWDRIKEHARLVFAPTRAEMSYRRGSIELPQAKTHDVDRQVVDRFAADLDRELHDGLQTADVKRSPDPQGERVPFITMAVAIDRTFPRLWRQGRHYGQHVYEGDRPVATFFCEDDARLAVEAVNGLLTRDEVDG